jgi:mono/diheme cytochrome c family protein
VRPAAAKPRARSSRGPVAVLGVAPALVLGAFALIATGAGPQEDTAAEGKRLFTEHGCYGCHTLEKYGTPIAADLSHIGSKYSYGDLTRWLHDPSAQKPTAHMPKIALSDTEANALAAYLAGQH